MLFERSAVRSKPVEDQNQSARRSSGRERSYSDQIITPEGALTVSAVLAAFTILAEDISSLPLILYQRKARGKDRAWGSPYYRLMHDAPNPEHTSMVFREIMVGHLLAWGNFYGQMIWDESGTVTEIWPLRPDRMSVERLDGQRIYKYLSTDGKERMFTSDDILHIPAFGFDGLIGYSRISLARNAIGLSIAAEKFGSKFFSNDARPGVVLKHPGKLSDAAFKHLQESWNAEHKGVDNSHNPAILEEGLDVHTVGIPPEDAQFLQTRQFQVAEIARIFRVPPHMIGDVSKSTSWGTGIDSQEQGYVSHTLRPWTVRIEQSLSQQLLLEKDRQYQFFEHLFDGLVRGDLAARYSAYVQALNNGIMSPNEVRSRENMNPYDGGDEFYRPLNMAPAAQSAPAAGASVSVETGTMTVTKALRPMVAEIAQRVVKREMNDLRGASQRYLVKNNEPVAFAAWGKLFYQIDHRVFLMRAFRPLLETVEILTGAVLELKFESYFEQYTKHRVEVINGMSADEITSEIDAWLVDITDQMTADLFQILEA